MSDKPVTPTTENPYPAEPVGSTAAHKRGAWAAGFAAGRAAATPSDTTMLADALRPLLTDAGYRCVDPDACTESAPCAVCVACSALDTFDGRAAATPDPPDGFRVTVYSGQSATDERPAAVSTRYAGATDLHDVLRRIGLEWKQADYMGQRQVVVTVDPVAHAASPDERLREALREIVAAFPSPPGREMDDEEIEKWYADHGDWFQRLAALAAADREAPDDPKETT